MGEIVSEKLEEIAADNGNVTRNSVEMMFQSQFSSFKEKLESGIKKSVRDSIVESGLSVRSNSNRSNETNDHAATTRSNDSFTLFNYSNRFFHVPEDFIFPEEVKRKRAWRFWLLGMDFKGSSSIRPFRKLKPSMLPTKELKVQYNNEWKPILSKMEKVPGLIIPNDLQEISNAFLDHSFSQASDYLKTNVCSFIWTKGLNHETWTIGTWSTKTLPNQIRKYGSDQDKASLPAPTHHNRPHQEKRTLQRKNSSRSRRKRQQPEPSPPTAIPPTVN